MAGKSILYAIFTLYFASAAIATIGQFLIAEASTDWVPSVVQLATAGGFGAIVWYMLIKHIPSIEQRHKEERQTIEERHAKERSDWREYLSSRDAAVDQMMNKIAECQ